MGTLEKQTEYLEELTEGIKKELDDNGLESVNEWLDDVRAEYTDVEVAEEIEELPSKTKQAVKHSYGEVLSLLGILQPTDQTWEQKVRRRKDPCKPINRIMPSPFRYTTQSAVAW